MFIVKCPRASVGMHQHEVLQPLVRHELQRLLPKVAVGIDQDHRTAGLHVLGDHVEHEGRLAGPGAAEHVDVLLASGPIDREGHIVVEQAEGDALRAFDHAARLAACVEPRFGGRDHGQAPEEGEVEVRPGRRQVDVRLLAVGAPGRPEEGLAQHVEKGGGDGLTRGQPCRKPQAAARRAPRLQLLQHPIVQQDQRNIAASSRDASTKPFRSSCSARLWWASTRKEDRSRSNAAPCNAGRLMSSATAARSGRRSGESAKRSASRGCLGSRCPGRRDRPGRAAHQIVEANALARRPQVDLVGQVWSSERFTRSQPEMGGGSRDHLAQGLLQLARPRLDGGLRCTCRRPEREPAAVAEGHPQGQALTRPELRQEGLEPLLAAVLHAARHKARKPSLDGKTANVRFLDAGFTQRDDIAGDRARLRGRKLETMRHDGPFTAATIEKPRRSVGGLRLAQQAAPAGARADREHIGSEDGMRGANKREKTWRNHPAAPSQSEQPQ